MSWNPNAFIQFENLPASVTIDLAEHIVFNNGINTRVFKPTLEVQEGGFGEFFVNFAGYKIRVRKELLTTNPLVPEQFREYRIHF